jgi:polar amino acid transport system permease protein
MNRAAVRISVRQLVFCEYRTEKNMYLITMFEDMVEIFVENWDLFLIKGLTATILLSIMTVLFGTVFGALLALVKISNIKPLKWLVNAVVEVIRGTPMLLQLYISTFLIPVVIPAMNELENKKIICISLTLILNSAAYVSEIMRAGIQSVDIGQMEAGRAMGLGFAPTMMKIVVPQAIKNILPTLGNEFIALVKDTSVVSFVAAVDLYKVFTEIGNVNYEYLAPYLMMAIIYIVLVMLITLLFKFLEKQLRRDSRS